MPLGTALLKKSNVSRSDGTFALASPIELNQLPDITTPVGEFDQNAFGTELSTTLFVKIPERG